MATILQSWVGYLTRSYEQVKANLINKLPPEITDHSESNDLIIVLSLFAGLVEHLNLYIDRMAEEAFLGTAKRYSSVRKLAANVDYRAKAAITSYGEVIIELQDSNTNLPVVATSPVLIPLGSTFKNSNSLPYVLTEQVIIPVGSSKVYGKIRQYSTVTTSVTLLGNPSEKVSLGVSYVHKSLQVNIGPNTYTEVDSFGLSFPTSQHFMVIIEDDQVAYIQFGDGINGVVPPPGIANLDYLECAGPTGNVPPNSITEWLSPPPTTGMPNTKLGVYNPNYTSSGKFYEDIEDIRRNAPLSLRTLYRAVSKQDFTDLALLAPGVGKAQSKSCCGECVKLYIGPSTKGVALSPLLVNTLAYMNPKKVVGSCINIYPAGITRIFIDVDIAPKYGITPLQAQIDFAEELDTLFGYNTSDVNRRISISDIVAAIDGIKSLDYVTLNSMWAEPYARKVNGFGELTWNRSILPGSLVVADWELVYDGITGEFQVYYNNLQLANAVIGTTWVDPNNIISFDIQPGPYLSGDKWAFRTYPFNQDIVLDDMSIPIVDVQSTTPTPSGFYIVNVTQQTNLTPCNC